MMRAAALAALYGGAALLITWPLAAHLTTHLGAPEGAGDPFLNLWVLGWGARAWLTDPWGTLQGAAFDAPIFHPSALTLTYTDHQLLQALLATPIVGLSGNLTLAYNFVLLVSLAASGLAMHVLAREASGSHRAALLAGLAWCCWPYRTAHLIHLQLQALYLLPLAVWALLRVMAGRRWRDAWLLAACAAGQALLSVYYGVMTAVVLVAGSLTLAVQTGQWRNRRLWSRLMAAAVLGALLVMPATVPYLRSQAAEGFGRNLFEAANHAAAVQSYLQVPPTNMVYGQSGLLAPRAPAAGERDRRHVEHQMFPGLVIVLLGLVGLGMWTSDRRPVVVLGAVLVTLGLWLSLGPEGPLGLYRALAAWAFGFEAIRAPARFSVVAMLGLGVLAAAGAAWLLCRPAVLARRHGATLLTTALAGLILLEYVNAPLAFVPAPATDTAVGRWLRDEPGPGAVLYWPIGLDRESTPAMVAALQHARPIVNGYSGQRPASYATAVEALSTLPAPEGLAMLRALDVRFVVAQAPWDPLPGGAPLVERARLDGGVVYEVRWTPEAEAALDAVAGPEAPPAGPAGFRPGEVSTYQVRWIGDVSAGSITLTALAPTTAEAAAWPAAAWRVEAVARTADWVSRFFEAHDRFSSIVDASFAPLLHERDIDEGSRELSRVYLYDAERRQVRTAGTIDGARALDAAATPWAPGARDPVGALFYLRTLPLVPGDEVRIPVNDAGRSLTVRVQATGLETLTTAAGAVEALRLEVAIERRLQRRQGVGGTIWLSADARRAPLRLDIAAGFGQVRVERVDYRP